MKELQANVYLYDPLFSKEEVEGYGAAYRDGFADMDCLVIVTDHREFREHDWGEIATHMRSKVIIDGRQVVEPGHVRELGFVYKGIGVI